jgi:hypothetical protein
LFVSLIGALAIAGTTEAAAQDHVYWTNLGATTIGRANIDGGGVDQSFIDTGQEYGICGVGVDAAHVYWAGGVTGTARD